MSETIAQTLSELIDARLFDSRLEQYLDGTFRIGPNSGSWYRTVCAKSGRDEAERLLAETVKRRHLDVYASTPKPIALGVVALAKAGYDGVVDITSCSAKDASPSVASWSPKHHKFVVFNSEVPGDYQQKEGGIFAPSPYGLLDLHAVILETGSGVREPATEISLVLPPWSPASSEPRKGRFVLVRFNIYGDDASACEFTVSDGNRQIVEDINLALKYLLGMVDNEGVRITALTRSIDGLLAFPDAEACIANNLPSLGGYLSAMAERLTASRAKTAQNKSN